jgi:hypothetical protein
MSLSQIEAIADRLWTYISNDVLIIWLQGTFDTPRDCILACMSKVVGYDLGTRCRDERFVSAMIERFNNTVA